jgi:4-amino-4-deoxy-L-arabinose transferase-like glycosyltransferase
VYYYPIKTPQMKFSNFIKILIAHRYILTLLVLSALFIASTIRYALRSFSYPIWDEQHYMHIAATAYRQFHHPSLEAFNYVLSVVPYHQPGYPLLLVPLLFIFGIAHTYVLGIIANGIFHIASMLAVYAIGRQYMTKTSSLLAAIIFLFYGWPLYFVHLTYAETATSALCVWAIYFLIKSNYFQKRSYSLLFGLFLGVGILTKWVAIIFVLGPLLYVLYQISKKQLFKKRIVLQHITLAGIISLLVPFYPYYYNFTGIVLNFTSHRVGGDVWSTLPAYKQNTFSLYNLTYYASTFEKLGIVFFILIVTGIIVALHRKSPMKIILWAVTIPFVFFTFFSILKDERFIVPIFPYLALISALVFETMPASLFKKGLITLTVVLSIGTFFGTVWGRGPMKESLYSFPGNQMINIHLTSISRPPYIYKRVGKEIIEYIKTDSEQSGITDPQVLNLFYLQELDEPMMTHNLYHLEKPLTINNYLGTGIQDPVKEAPILARDVMNSDYIVTKTGKRIDTLYARKNYRVPIALQTLFNQQVKLSDYFEKKTDIYVFQDSSTVTIFKKKKTLTDQELREITVKLTAILAK